MNLMSWQFQGQFVLFTAIIALKPLVKTMNVAFIVNYICKYVCIFKGTKLA